MTTEQYTGVWFKKADDDDSDAVCGFEQKTVEDWFSITSRMSASLLEFETDFFELNTIDGVLIDENTYWGECDGAFSLTAFATAATLTLAAISL